MYAGEGHVVTKYVLCWRCDVVSERPSRGCGLGTTTKGKQELTDRRSPPPMSAMHHSLKRLDRRVRARSSFKCSSSSMSQCRRERGNRLIPEDHSVLPVSEVAGKYRGEPD